MTDGYRQKSKLLCTEVVCTIFLWDKLNLYCQLRLGSFSSFHNKHSGYFFLFNFVRFGSSSRQAKLMGLLFGWDNLDLFLTTLIYQKFRLTFVKSCTVPQLKRHKNQRSARWWTPLGNWLLEIVWRVYFILFVNFLVLFDSWLIMCSGSDGIVSESSLAVADSSNVSSMSSLSSKYMHNACWFFGHK